MNITAKIKQAIGILRSSRTPAPLIFDMMRLKTGPYLAECNGLKFKLIGGSHEWYTLYENVIREDYFRDDIQVAEGDIVVDIGANFGAFTAVASRKVGASGKVVSFEPNPHVFDRLVEMISDNNLGNVVARNEAVSDRNGKISLFLQHRSSLATSFPDIDGRKTDKNKSIDVSTVSIESIICSLGKIKLLKIDCEGGEYSLFDVLNSSILSNVAQISMEIHDIPNRSQQDVIEKIRRMDYEVIVDQAMIIARKREC